MIKLHPSDTELLKFADGTLASAQSLMVSAHSDMCSSCSSKINHITETLASQEFSDEDKHSTIPSEYVSMFEQITNNDQLIDPSPFVSSKTIELEGRKFTLPETLSRYKNRIGEWSHLLGKLWQAPVDIGAGRLAQLIYMEKGGSVPEHTHKGSELTLVLDGNFQDELHVYESGDYISLNNTHTHSPESFVEEGCLVFTIIDQPLHFTSGWAKLINPLSHLYFKVNTKT